MEDKPSLISDQSILPMPPVKATKRNNRLMFGMVGVASVLLCFIVVGLLVLASRNPEIVQTGTMPPSATGSSSGQTNPPTSVTHPETLLPVMVERSATITYTSPNTQINSSRRWEISFTIPSDMTITKSADPANAASEQLVLENSDVRLVLTGAINDSPIVGSDRNFGASFINPELTDGTTYRVWIPFVNGWGYGDYFIESSDCGESYCATASIKELIISCSVKSDDAKVGVCDEVVKNMKLSFIVS